RPDAVSKRRRRSEESSTNGFNRRPSPSTIGGNGTPGKGGWFHGGRMGHGGSAPLTNGVLSLAKLIQPAQAARPIKITGGRMKRLLAGTVVFLMIGCMSSITQRFDALTQRMGDTNEQIHSMNVKLDETNRHLAQIERSMKKLSGEDNEGGPAPVQRP